MHNYVTNSISSAVKQKIHLLNMSLNTSVLKELDNNVLSSLPSPINGSPHPGAPSLDGHCSSTPKMGNVGSEMIPLKGFSKSLGKHNLTISLASSKVSSEISASPYSPSQFKPLVVGNKSPTPQSMADNSVYSPGKFVPFNLTIEESDEDTDDVLPLCYSLASSWSPDELNESDYVTPESSHTAEESTEVIPKTLISHKGESGSHTRSLVIYPNYTPDNSDPGTSSTVAHESLLSNESAYHSRKRRRTELWESSTRHSAEGDDYPAQFSRTIAFLMRKMARRQQIHFTASVLKLATEERLKDLNYKT